MSIHPIQPVPDEGEPHSGLTAMVAAILTQVTDLNHKVSDLDTKITEHIRDETAEIAQEIVKVLSTAFPHGDCSAHRLKHEEEDAKIEERKKFWGKMLFEISKWGLIGFLGWLAIEVWQGFLRGPK